jgi:pimeloyl-ACP methyl ester carboxylesterase
VSEPRTAPSDSEIPVFFPAQDGQAFGLVTLPAGEPTGTAILLLPSGGRPLAISRNRLWVRLAHALAELGHHTLRFDDHGSGESTGTLGRFNLDRPFTADVKGALEAVQRMGAQRFVLVGACFGARTALAAAAEIEELAGLVMISPPIRNMEKGERHATRVARDWTVWRYLRRAASRDILRGLADRDTRRDYTRFARA